MLDDASTLPDGAMLYTAPQPAESTFTTPDCPECGCVQDGQCLCNPSKPSADPSRGEPVAGYTMVPVEPTPQMIAAFRSGFQNELHKNDRRRTMSAEEAGLRAMLEAVGCPDDSFEEEGVALKSASRPKG